MPPRLSGKYVIRSLCVLACVLTVLGTMGTSAFSVREARASAAATDSSSQHVLTQQDLAHYRAAFKQVDRGRWARAIAKADRATDPLPAKAIRWLSYLAGAADSTFMEIHEFLRENRKWPKREKLREKAEAKLESDVPAHVVLSFFAEAPPTTLNGFNRFADALANTARDDEIGFAARQFWLGALMSKSDEKAFRRRFRKFLTPEDELQRLDTLLWDGHRHSAMRQARRVPDAYRRLAEARVQLRRRGGGVDRAIARVPASLQFDPGLIYERVRWRRRKGRTQDAIALLTDPDMQKSHPDLWWDERARLSRQALQDGDAELAYRVAAEHRATEGASFAEAEWFAGWVALRHLNDPVKAFPHFQRMYGGVGFPVSLARAAYWAGRAAEEGGKRGIAVQWYATAAQHTASFYGQLAGRKIDPTRRPKLPPEPIVSGDLRDVFNADELPRLIRLLSQIGASDTVRTLTRHLAKELYEPQTLSMLAALALDIGRADLAVYTARQAIKRGIVLPRTGYPDITTEKARISDDTIIFGLIRQESGFDIDAISSAGARGLMQLMPATAKVVARWEKLRYRRAKLTKEPAYNIQLGSAYLSDLLEKFDGALPLSLAGYNAGPHRVNRWIKKFGDPRQGTLEDMIDWMESIPFNETRDYVQRVLENIAVYRQRDRTGEPPLVFQVEPADFAN